MPHDNCAFSYVRDLSLHVNFFSFSAVNFGFLIN